MRCGRSSSWPGRKRIGAAWRFATLAGRMFSTVRRDASQCVGRVCYRQFSHLECTRGRPSRGDGRATETHRRTCSGRPRTVAIATDKP
jgi:hypothetical protein